MKWWNAIDKLNFRVVPGDGFSVKIHSEPGGSVVRYIESGRALTLLVILEDETDRWGRELIFFRAIVVTLRVPSVLKWDGGPPITQEEALIAVDRIRSAVQRKFDRYRLVIDDEIYRLQQLDFDKLQVSID